MLLKSSLKIAVFWAIICCCWLIKFTKIAFWFLFSSRSASRFSLSNSIFWRKNSIISEFDLRERFCLLWASSSPEFRFLVCPIVSIATCRISKALFCSLVSFFLAFSFSASFFCKVSSEMFITSYTSTSNSLGSPPPSPVWFLSLFIFTMNF